MMHWFERRRNGFFFGLLTAVILLAAQVPAHAATPKILDRTAAKKIMPATVFFRGQTAPTQGRNSGGVLFANGKYMLAALVDTSGYATEVKQKYQGYLLTEVTLDFGGHRLGPGAYGFGFIGHNRFVVLNIGGEQVLEATWHAFVGEHPVPLEVLPAKGGYQLCSGRECVDFH
jgi:hypothetical protein